MKAEDPVPADPEAWIAALGPWQRPLVDAIRSAIVAAAPFAETVKWRNLVFLCNGPAILIHAEDDRVLLGFWRGKRLCDREPALKPSGKYELANWTFRAGESVDTNQITALARAAAALNADLGDPTRLA
ncbi:MAG: DUF1801 domain-containing protein [Sphingomonas sp.]